MEEKQQNIIAEFDILSQIAVAGLHKLHGIAQRPNSQGVADLMIAGYLQLRASCQQHKDNE